MEYIICLLSRQQKELSDRKNLRLPLDCISTNSIPAQRESPDYSIRSAKSTDIRM